MTSPTSLESGVTDGVLRITFTRPEHFNALTGEMVVETTRLLREAVTRDDVRVVVIGGTGAAFSAGADIAGENPQDRLDERAVDAANELIRAVTGCDKPVVCAVNGIAAGVGMSLAISGDLVVATESAGFTLVFSRVGLMPDGGASLTVAAAVGRAKAMRMALTSDVLEARAAYDAGLITHVFPDDEYDEQLARIVRRLAVGPPLSFAATKRAINAATLAGLEDAFARERTGQTVLLRTEDVAEGMRAFAEKRRPEFRGH